ncbi:hypothetical protein H7J84_36290, partial [Mycobacterium goodii]|uniref:alanine and proline-rich secreted protein Apa n=1 Tax=Mycolicibacterium goodii TaxID=134601 RepID=UPI002265ABA1
MDESDAMSHRRRGLSKKLTLAAMTGATAVAVALPTVAHAEPAPPPPPPAPGNTFLPAPPPADPNAAPAGSAARRPERGP